MRRRIRTSGLVGCAHRCAAMSAWSASAADGGARRRRPVLRRSTRTYLHGGPGGRARVERPPAGPETAWTVWPAQPPALRRLWCG
eukprot:scaffold13535_cov114-Isochrysis_galbana.AAC.5